MMVSRRRKRISLRTTSGKKRTLLLQGDISLGKGEFQSKVLIPDAGKRRINFERSKRQVDSIREIGLGVGGKRGFRLA